MYIQLTLTLFSLAELHESSSRQSATVEAVRQREEVGAHLRSGWATVVAVQRSYLMHCVCRTNQTVWKNCPAFILYAFPSLHTLALASLVKWSSRVHASVGQLKKTKKHKKTRPVTGNCAACRNRGCALHSELWCFAPAVPKSLSAFLSRLRKKKKNGDKIKTTTQSANYFDSQ